MEFHNVVFPLSTRYDDRLGKVLIDDLANPHFAAPFTHGWCAQRISACYSARRYMTEHLEFLSH